jgi:hypothetical protein
MGLINWLFGDRRRANTMYRDEDFGFEVTIPPGWRKQTLVGVFAATGGRLSLRSRDGATANFSCGPPDSGSPTDKIKRADLARTFLAHDVPGAASVPLRDVATSLSGEENVARAEVRTRDGFHGIVSVIHKGIEYVIQYHGTERTRSEVEDLIASFRLPGSTTQVAPQPAVDAARVVAKLDDQAPQTRESARKQLIQMGKMGTAAVPSLLASVNACNQAIMAAGAGLSGHFGSTVDALRYRIEVLGAIGDPGAIPAILNAIGDAARNYGREVEQLLHASEKALSAIGQPAVPRIADVIDTPTAAIRLALIRVLVQIGGTQARDGLTSIIRGDSSAEVRRKAEDGLSELEN